jgi:hypothetical protein
MSAIGPPPPGLDPNESRAGVIIGVVCFVLAVASTALALRIYTRGFLLKKLGPDDYIACFAYVSAC